MKKIQLIDFLKGYSIFTIVVFHLLQQANLIRPFDKLISFGGTGVHLFVLLSGFGLYLSYSNRPISYVTFLRRRLSKIYFPYVAVVLLTALIALIIPIYETSLYALGGHIFFYKMFDESIIESYGSHLWFISMIVQFYLTFYVFVYFKRLLGNRYFVLANLCVSIGWVALVLYLGKEQDRAWGCFFLQYAWEFALGMALVSKIDLSISRFGRPSQKLALVVFGVLNCVIYAGLALLGGETGKMVNDIAALLGYTSIGLFIYSFKIGWINNFLLFTGKVSYSLYLLHVLVLMLMLEFIHDETRIIALLCTVLASYVVAYYYEKSTAYFYQVVGYK